MANGSESRFLGLHALRLKGFAESAALAGAPGPAAGEIERHLDAHRQES